jgi:hypothetical protein
MVHVFSAVLMVGRNLMVENIIVKMSCCEAAKLGYAKKFGAC